MAVLPLVNGYRYSYASIELAIKTVTNPKPLIIKDVSDISYADSIEREFMRGTASGPLGWTRGVYDPGEGSLSIAKSSVRDLILGMGPGYMMMPLLINVSYFELTEGLTTDNLTASIIGIEDAQSYGAGPSMASVRLKFLNILRNGMPALLNNVAAPTLIG